MEAIYSIFNLLVYAGEKQIDFFLERNIISVLMTVMKESENSEILIMILNCMEKIMGFEGHKHTNYKVIIMKMLEETGGVQRLEDLQHHPDQKVYIKLNDFIYRFFDTH